MEGRVTRVLWSDIGDILSAVLGGGVREDTPLTRTGGGVLDERDTMRELVSMATLLAAKESLVAMPSAERGRGNRGDADLACGLLGGTGLGGREGRLGVCKEELSSGLLLV